MHVSVRVRRLVRVVGVVVVQVTDTMRMGGCFARQRRMRMRPRLGAMVVFVPVVPELRLVEQEEEHQSDQERAEQLLGIAAAFQRFRQQMHERSGKQRAGGEAEQVLFPQAAT
jgi:hypothetical protein